MSSKHSKRSKVSVNEMSAEGESDSDLELNETNDNSDENDCDSNELQTNNEDNKETCNKSWADAINRVLTTKSKNLLSKAKKDKDINIGKKQKTPELSAGLEFVGEDGSVVNNEEINDKNKSKKRKTDESINKINKKSKLNKNEWEILGKMKPKIDDKERERMLTSIATKGVVQLFNAVREQQQSIKTAVNETGFSETKRDKAMSRFTKTKFLDKLKQKTQNINDNNKSANNSNTKSTEEQKWKVLRDDFMIGAKMKDWDKDSESDLDDNE